MTSSLRGGALAVVVVLATAAAAAAGSGSIGNGKMDLTVYFAYDEQDMSSWKPVFDEFSKLLYDATEKQLQLGTVKWTKCLGEKDRADIWVMSGNGGASANVNGIGKTGYHMFISQAHKSTSGLAIGQFGLTHESGHYVFGCYDEYKGTVDGANAKTADHYCVTESSEVACIMDGGTTISPSNKRHEFCTKSSGTFTSTKHQGRFTNAAGQIIETRQQDKLGVSCWERIAAAKPGGFTLTEPTVEPTQNTGGHVAVTYDSLACKLPLAICLDRSGSMIGTPIELARQGASLAVDLTIDGQYLAVTSFADYPRTDYSLTEITGPAVRTAAKTAISGIEDGGYTNIGGGLRTSMEELMASGQTGGTIILLTDGIHNTGVDPSTVLPSLVSNKIVVQVIGLGSNIDVSQLQSIANETGGSYSSATDPSQLSGIFAGLSFESSGNDVVAEDEQALPEGATTTTDVTIEPGVTEATFLILWESDLDAFELALTSPSGMRYDANSTEYSTEGRSIFYRIVSPTPGSWRVRVRATTVGSGSVGEFATQVAAQNPLVAVAGGVDAELPTYPDPIRMSVVVSAGGAVAGADIFGTVTRPDGSRNTIRLVDNGSELFGDEAPDDGIYHGLFSNYLSSQDYSSTQSYQVSLDVDVPNGTLIVDPFEEGGEDEAVPAFVRVVNFSGSAQGIPNRLVSPSPDFSASVIEGPAPLTVRFADGTLGNVQSWSWRFGDGDTSEDANPTHVYEDMGTYSVELTVGGAGVEATTTKAAYITVLAPEEGGPQDDLSRVRVYPTPFRRSAGHTTLTIDALVPNSTVRIFTLQGRLIKELRDDRGSGRVTWDAVHAGGKPLASGIYLVYLKAPNGDTRSIKMAVER